MPSRCVALVTRDAGLYADLADMFRDGRIPTLSLLPGLRIPSHVVVVLTTPAEAPGVQHPHVLSIAPPWDRTSLLAAVNERLEGGPPNVELVVGIDPGPRPGYAVLSGQLCLVRGALEAPEAVGVLARRLGHQFPDRHLRFRVGSGDRASRTRIVAALWGVGGPIELVDENGTSPHGRRRPRDAVAARRIAELAGRPVGGMPSAYVTAGEISNVQRNSREVSGGDFTISRHEANRVLVGELTLAQAVTEGRRRYHVRNRGPPNAPGQPY